MTLPAAGGHERPWLGASPSITVNGNWRVIFRFVGQDVELVDYLDYH